MDISLDIKTLYKLHRYYPYLYDFVIILDTFYIFFFFRHSLDSLDSSYIDSRYIDSSYIGEERSARGTFRRNSDGVI